MTNVSAERVALAEAVLRPIPSFKSQPQLTKEQKLDRTIDYLENHNAEVKATILAQGVAAQENFQKSYKPPPYNKSASAKQTKAISKALRQPLPRNAPTPPVWQPPPPPRSGSASHPHANPTAVSIARNTASVLKKVDEQANITLAPYYAERERLKRAAVPKAIEVPPIFGAGFGAAAGPRSTEGELPSPVGQGNYDRSRDPRVRHG